jgi:protoheme IX farnesyltransferase
MLLAVSLMPFKAQMSGTLYLAGAVPLGVVFVYRAVRLLRSHDDAEAMRTFGYSILYLTLIFALLLADHYLRLLTGTSG